MTKSTTVLETVLSGLKPVPADAPEAQVQLFDRLGKYARIRTPQDTTPPYVRLDNDEDLVAVWDKGRTELAGIMHRRLVSSKPLDGGRVARTYEFVGLRITGKGASAASVALESVQAVAKERFEDQASGIEGFADEPF